MTEGMARPSPRLVSGLVVFVLAFGAAGYAWLGNRDGLRVSPGAVAVAVAAAEAASGPQAADGPGQVEAMVQRLADRLRRDPDDAEGWSMLGRSYSVLGRHPQALLAFQQAIDLRPADAQAYADAAAAMGMAGGTQASGGPGRLIAKALQLDPDNVKALALAGTLAFDSGDAAVAARHWQHALRSVPPDSELARQLQAALDAASERLPSSPGPTGPAPRSASANGDPATSDRGLAARLR